MPGKKNMIRRRDYGTSSPALLEETKTACRAGMSIRKAAIKFKVKRSTLGDHLKCRRGCIGAPKELSANEETCLAETVCISGVLSLTYVMLRSDILGLI